MERHDLYMGRCFQLAQKGLGNTNSNPLVGCVVVHQDKILGEGWHRVYGGPHGEVNAINQIKDKELLKQSTLYVNLEPCCHYGKTPPCTDLIIKYQIPKVVISNIDPNPKMAGKGISLLKSNGCIVTTGIRESEGFHLNKRFFTFQTKNRPYIILKWAQSDDGFIDIKRESEKTPPCIISNAISRQLTHKWRTEEGSILVGTVTALKDNPSLTARDWLGNNPIRVVIDKNLLLPIRSNVFNSGAQTIIVNSVKTDFQNNLQWIMADFEQPLLPQVISILRKKNISSILVEGGTKTIEKFINTNLWDEARVFTASQKIKDGVQSPVLKHFRKRVTQRILNDKLDWFFN